MTDLEKERYISYMTLKDELTDYLGQGAELYLDGLHLNAEGHRVMAERVAKVLAVMDRETMDP